MSQTLTRMPTEVFDIICRSTSSNKELKALRLTNRHMRGKTENVFAARTFSHMVISLTSENFQYLQQVAYNKPYGRIVETICIVPDCTKMTVEKLKFREKGMDTWWLGQILPHFKNLKSIQIGQYHSDRRRWIVDEGRIAGSRVNALAHGFHVLLNSLNTSGKQLEKISAGFEPYGKHDRNSIDHLVLQLPDDIKLGTSLSFLKELDLVLEIRSHASSVHCETYLADFLKQTTNLQRLSLSFPDTCCAWLAGLPDVHLPSLTSLTLKKAHLVSATELYAFIARHSTLTSLNLTLLQFNESDPFSGLAECLSGLKLSSIHFQQLTNLHPYCQLMVFGGDQAKICSTCYQDVEAAFLYIEGPKCEHATISVKGEHEVYAALQSRLQDCSLLMRRSPGWMG